jgi:hypothetical protein
MNNIFLYLLGAGASCQVLPLASTFSTRLATFCGELRRAGPKDSNNIPNASPNDPSWGKNRDNLLDAISWLAEESSHHFSVDTFAKKLFIRGDLQKLKKLKAVLSAYLVIEQSRHHVDQRYDAFLASILDFDNSFISLPGRLRILTWNYDTQLEKAFYGFCEDKSMTTDRVTFNKSIYRINGYCGTDTSGYVSEAFSATLNTRITPAWEAGIKLYNEYIAKSSTPEPKIDFAWEDLTHTKLKKVGSELLSDITSIVVIGYSFPYFNREIDNHILEQCSNVSRIYLQCPEGTHASIEERINKNLLPHDIEIIRVTNTDLFFIPDDF